MSESVAKTELPIAYSWQMPQWQQLAQLVDSARLPHALLISGPDGIGKHRFAQAFAASLLCEQASGFSACGQCRSCQLLLAGNHPDFREVCPEEGKRQIGIDQVRELQGFVGKFAHREGGKKVLLIHPAEAMNHFTANALLKTLEEPAGDTLLMLISHAPSQLLPTIRSRCLQMKFGVPGGDVAKGWLQHYVGDPAQAEHLLAEAAGRPLAAKALFDNDGLSRWLGYDGRLSAVVSGSLSPLQFAEELAGEEVLDVLDWWLGRLMALSRHLLAERPVPPGVWQDLAGRDSRLVMDQIDKALQLRAKLQRGAPLNKRLLFEDLLLSWFAAVNR
jgi:DNA polymerase III subunit delta'